MLFLLLLRLKPQGSKGKENAMGMIDNAVELQADAYEEMIAEYKRIKYSEMIKELNKDEKSI